jgi:hypothetical protein
VANPKWLGKYLTIKPEVRQIFNDLDAWLNYCRFNMIKYDEADLYKSPAYKEWMEKRKRRQQWQARQKDGQNRNGYNARTSQ